MKKGQIQAMLNGVVCPNFVFKNTLQYRKTWLFGKCLSTKITPEIVDFDASGLLGGIIFKGRKPGIDPDAGLNIPGIYCSGIKVCQIQYFLV